jgi:hypothetical protein
MSSQPQLKKAKKNIFFFFSYFKKESKDESISEINSSSNTNVPIPDEQPSSEPQIVESTQVDISYLERDLGLRLPVWSYPINEIEGHIQIENLSTQVRELSKNT